MGKERKSFPLRISQELFRDLRAWAEQEMRSVNGQIEFILRDAVRRRKSGRTETPPKPPRNDGDDEATDEG